MQDEARRRGWLCEGEVDPAGGVAGDAVGGDRRPAQEPVDEIRCLLPEGCGPVLIEDELLCFLPEGCDTNDDGVPDLGAGEPVPDVELDPGAVQYDNAL